MKKKPGAKGKEGPQVVLRRLEKAVETMNLGLTITDMEGRILFTNRAEASLHGYDQAELIGQEARIFAPHAFWKPSRVEGMGEMKSWRREATAALWTDDER